jgi:hypothetical protein
MAKKRQGQKRAKQTKSNGLEKYTFLIGLIVVGVILLGIALFVQEQYQARELTQVSTLSSDTFESLSADMDTIDVDLLDEEVEQLATP